MPSLEVHPTSVVASAAAAEPRGCVFYCRLVFICRSTKASRWHVSHPGPKLQLKIVLASFLSHTHFFFFGASNFIDSICFFSWTAQQCVGVYRSLALDDHKPTVGTRAPRRPNHKHVWIYLSNSEFISRSLPLVFLLDVLFPVPTEIAGSFTLDYGEAAGLKVVQSFSRPRLRPPGAAPRQLALAGMDVCH